ncbi:DUF5117 domain-containing protein [Mucilaginibacter conchicola]|uniref:DUF5117 domain-containing protein n=1 Tax=Mucilaginibacter conchicola TaxID=2303333 RepID=A0A372NNM3_9SPHI|nr:zinc-dependent metalloprotease [Mucilaginibacter conchicola]RFZ90230.1 DUF5117 domain-containing protein [Mucilaginibacter conchicola]
MKNTIKHYHYLILVAISFLLGQGLLYAQTKPIATSWEQVEELVKKDTSAKNTVRSKIKKYGEVITKDFKTQRGLFTIHRSAEKAQTLFEFSDTVLHKDIMVINRLSKAPGDAGMYPGEELDEQTIQLELGRDSTIKVRFVKIFSRADSSSSISKAVANISLNAIAASLPIIAYSTDKKSYVVDMTTFLKEKNFLNSIDGTTELANRLSIPSMKDVNVEFIHAYPINVEISSTKNYDSKQLGATGQPVTIETHCSFIQLPETPMRRRFFDPRVGYFADDYLQFSDKQQRAEVRKNIFRWKLEPKKADEERWKKGELVEPEKPIIIYIDPATPKQWRPFLVQGINDWQKGFEQAGFKNAILGKEWPENDTTMHMDDARYSFINYFPSAVENAYGPQIHDPRSGEIIQTHIGWYHNVMTILHDWFMIQASAVAPNARKAKFDDALMGQLIRFVSSHEVGHTLGLRHNFGSSSRTPVDSLRNIRYLAAHGHTSSIMDYARFNYVAQPEDHIPEEYLFPKIGEYDKWAIEWGYKYIAGVDAEADKNILSKMIVSRTGQNPRLWFGDGETRHYDPRCQTEDLGDDAVKASTYGIKNLKRILPNLPTWTAEEGDLGKNLFSLYKELKDQYARYMNHVLKNIGGVEYTIKTSDETGPSILPVSRRKQISALKFFGEQLFETPVWLLNRSVLSRTTIPDRANFVEDIQVRVLNSLMDIARINKLLANTKQFGSKTCTASEYIDLIHEMIWKELKGSGSLYISSYRRNLQKSYFQNLLLVLSSKEEADAETDGGSMLRADLLHLQAELKAVSKRRSDPMTRYHISDLQNRIKNLLDHHE